MTHHVPARISHVRPFGSRQEPSDFGHFCGRFLVPRFADGPAPQSGQSHDVDCWKIFGNRQNLDFRGIAARGLCCRGKAGAHRRQCVGQFRFAVSPLDTSTAIAVTPSDQRGQPAGGRLPAMTEQRRVGDRAPRIDIDRGDAQTLELASDSGPQVKPGVPAPVMVRLPGSAASTSSAIASGTS